MSWTQSQQIALAIVPKFSSLLSLFGSSWIVAEVSFDDRKKARKGKHVYSRLLFAMSIYDILESIWNFASTWPIPRGTAGIWGAIGTTQTCTAQGFFLQLGLAVPIYNACLSIYYLLVIKYTYSDTRLQRRVEPFMHVTAFVISFGTALACVFLKQYNNANLWCWIAPLPSDCLDSARFGSQGNCIRGDNAWIFRWAFYFGPLWTCILIAIGTMIFVYKAVRDCDKRTLQYRRPQVRFGGATECQVVEPEDESEQDEAPKKSNFRRESNLFVEPSLELDPRELDDSSDSDAHSPHQLHMDEKDDDEQQSRPQQVPIHVRASGVVQSIASTISISPQPRKGSDEAMPPTGGARRSQSSKAASSVTMPRLSISSKLKSWKKHRTEDAENHARSHDVFHQALWYLGAFLLTHFFSTTNRSLQLAIGHTFYPLIILHSFFDPLQGFLNFVVYRRPRYLRYRRNNKLSRVGAARRALRWSLVTEGDSSRRRNPSSAVSVSSTGSSPLFGRLRNSTASAATDMQDTAHMHTSGFSSDEVLHDVEEGDEAMESDDDDGDEEILERCDALNSASADSGKEEIRSDSNADVP